MKDLDRQSLPDDPEALKSLLEDYHTQLQHKDNKLLQLEEQIKLLLSKRFGTSSERHPGQHELFDEAEQETAEAEPLEPPEVTVASDTKKKPGRKPLPEQLPRVEVIHDLPEDEKVCAHDGHPLHKIGEDVSEQLDIVPARIQVIRNIRVKYGCRHCEEGVITAPIPTQIIPKSIATPGLLAYVAVSKYLDALPLYRLEKLFERIGVTLSRRTLSAWMIQTAGILGPLMVLLQGQLRSGRVLHMDETRVQVLAEEGKMATSQSYMWVTRSGGSDPPIVWYQYEPGRGRDVPMRLLQDFKGHLVTDGYAGYKAITARAEVTGVGCWAHARRKFDEALKVQGGKKAGRAQYVLNEIRKLYAIERDIKCLSPNEKCEQRQARARPVVAKMRLWLDKSLPEVAPKTTLGKALGYLSREWPRLVHYLDNGELPIDNNACENAVRPFVIGRKNWLFSQSVKGAEASATIYSLIETARLNGHEPYRYLRYVLTEIAKGNEHYEALLPHNLDVAATAG
ncbi:MAG: IS66 family transposase [bacterium]